MCNGECEFRTVVYQGKEYDDLEISRCGIMRNRKSGNIYAWNNYGKGYLCAMYHIRKGLKKKMKQHRALMETFVPNPENKPFINHIDGNKLNNSLSNLEWCTHRENCDHALRTGLYDGLCGENSYMAKLTEEDVLYIRKNLIPKDKKMGFRAMAKKFNISVWSITDAYYGKTWKHIGEEYGKE
jgi:hypothetical protein